MWIDPRKRSDPTLEVVSGASHLPENWDSLGFPYVWSLLGIYGMKLPYVLKIDGCFR